MPKGSTQHKLAFKGDTIMNIQRYTAADLNTLMDKINRNSIGMDEYFDRLFNLHETTTNYPPYNLVQVSSVESRLELALAGFKKKIKKRKLSTCTKVWLNGRLHEPGRSVTTRKLDQLLLRMGY